MQISPRIPSGAVGKMTAELTIHSLPEASIPLTIPVPRSVAAVSLNRYHSVEMLFNWADSRTTYEPARPS